MTGAEKSQHVNAYRLIMLSVLKTSARQLTNHFVPVAPW